MHISVYSPLIYFFLFNTAQRLHASFDAGERPSGEKPRLVNMTRVSSKHGSFFLKQTLSKSENSCYLIVVIVLREKNNKKKKQVLLTVGLIGRGNAFIHGCLNLLLSFSDFINGLTSQLYHPVIKSGKGVVCFIFCTSLIDKHKLFNVKAIASNTYFLVNKMVSFHSKPRKDDKIF